MASRVTVVLLRSCLYFCGSLGCMKLCDLASLSVAWPVLSTLCYQLHVIHYVHVGSQSCNARWIIAILPGLVKYCCRVLSQAFDLCCHVTVLAFVAFFPHSDVLLHRLPGRISAHVPYLKGIAFSMTIMCKLIVLCISSYMYSYMRFSLMLYSLMHLF